VLPCCWCCCSSYACTPFPSRSEQPAATTSSSKYFARKMVNTEREEEMHEPPAPPERRVRARLEKQRPPAQIAPDKKRRRRRRRRLERCLDYEAEAEALHQLNVKSIRGLCSGHENPGTERLGGRPQGSDPARLGPPVPLRGPLNFRRRARALQPPAVRAGHRSWERARGRRVPRAKAGPGQAQ